MKKTFLFFVFLFSSFHFFAQQGVSFDREEFNFRHILRDRGEVKYRFNFKNQTGFLLLITKVYTDCTFFSLDWLKTSIEREGKGYVEVKINPLGRLGEFTEKIIVYTSANQAAPTVLTVTGNIVDKIPEPKIEEFIEHFGVLAENISERNKKFYIFAESLADYIMKKGKVVLQIESSMSLMPQAGYSKQIAQKRADDLQSEIVKAIGTYDLDSNSIVFEKANIITQGPAYSKKTQRSSESSKYQYVKILKK
jgi:hypothetical protein